MYIPGKVLLFYQDWEDGTDIDEAAKEEKAFAANHADSNSTAPQTTTLPYTCRVTDGTALALQTFEVDGFRCIGDHTTAAYYQCLGHVSAA